MEPRGRAACLGIAAVLFLWTCQFLTVHYNYGGNWTALFRIRPGMPLPDFLKSERLYTFPGTEGYDGQVYHLIAHDPWMLRGSGAAITDAPFRYQRILVPALAWLIALGQDRWIDASYIAVVLGFAFLGVYWLALVAARAGLAPEWGLAFVLAPATIVSIDRMTVDIALAALCVGFALYSRTWSLTVAAQHRRSDAYGTATVREQVALEPETDVNQWKVVAILACAVLTRETALPMLAGYAIYLFTRRRFLEGLGAAAAALPAVAWFVYLSRHGTPSPALSYIDWVPFAGLSERLVHPVTYDLPPLKRVAAMVFDYVALAGIVMALILAARMALKRRWDAQASAVYALAIAATLIRSQSVWVDVNAFGRVLTPLLLLTAIQGFRRLPWLALAPMILVDTRISLDLWSQAAGIFRRLFP
jgi:hypothetical protein